MPLLLLIVVVKVNNATDCKELTLLKKVNGESDAEETKEKEEEKTAAMPRKAGNPILNKKYVPSIFYCAYCPDVLKHPLPLAYVL